MKTSKCSHCNKDITYKTKPPIRCKACWKKYHSNNKTKRKKKWTHKGSKEALMFKVLNDMFPKDEYINNGYYSWLISPRGAPMQLDRYYPDLKIAFELQGIQHYEHTTYYHKTLSSFKYLQECDIIKKDTCEKRGITLIEIRYDEDISDNLIQTKLEGE